MELILEMIFLSLINRDVGVALTKILTWRKHITITALRTTKWVEPIEKTEFAAPVQNKNTEIFIVHLTTLP